MHHGDDDDDETPPKPQDTQQVVVVPLAYWIIYQLCAQEISRQDKRAAIIVCDGVSYYYHN